MMAKFLVPGRLVDDLQALQDGLEDEEISQRLAARTLAEVIETICGAELEVWHEAGILFDTDGAPVKKCIVAGYFCR